MLDKLVVLGGQEWQLGRSPLRVQDAEGRILVEHQGGAVLAALDPHAGPGVQLVCDVVYACIGARPPSIVPRHAGTLQPWPPPTSTARSPRSSAPTIPGGSPTRGSRSSLCTTRTTSRRGSHSASASRASTHTRAASTPRCTASSCGRCASTPATPAPRNR